MKLRIMDVHLYLLVSALTGFAHSFPQRGNLRLSDIDISSAQEINNLEPSAIPGIDSRSFSTVNSGNYVEATVEEVQNIIKSNPDLPRLTRGEILDLLDNITREDMEKLRRLNSNRKGKAILLVMPYSAKRNGETMEDLYTKRPVTQLIDTDKNSSSEEKTENVSRKPVFNNRNEIFRRDSIRTKATTTNIPPTVDTQPTSTVSSTVLTSKRTISYRSRTRPPRTRPTTTPKPLTTTRPFRRRRITTTTNIPITTFHNHRYSDENTDKFLPENAMRPTRPYIYRISRRTTTQKPDLNVAESYVENSYVKYDPTQGKERYESKDNNNIPSQQPVYSKYDEDMSDEIKNQQAIFKPLPSQTRIQLDGFESPHDSFQQESADIVEESPELNGKEVFKLTSIDSQHSKPSLMSPEDYIIPEHLKYVIDDLELKPTLQQGTSLEEAVKSVTVFPRTTSTTTEFPITPMPEFKEVAENLSPDMKNLLMTFGLLPSKEAEEKGPQQSGYYPEKAEDKPESYTGFKPLPEEGETDKEMDALLASFGLGRSARKGRKVKKEVRREQLVDFSVIPNSMIDIVQNLGLSRIPINKVYQNSLQKTETSKPTKTSNKSHQNEAVKEISLMRRTDELSNSIENGNSIEEKKSYEYSSKLEDEDNTKMEKNENHELNTTEAPDSKFLVFAESKTNTTEANPVYENMETTKETLTSVVFNPTDQKIVEHEKQQLDKLMELMKALKAINGSATEEDFKNIDLDTLKHFTEVLNNSQRLTLGEQLSMSEEEQKIYSTSTEIVTIIPAETPNEIESDSQVLEESFGGLQGADIETEAPEPKKLSNGLYYLIDWNTFLEVDDTKGRRVNLRFQPKVGDPNRFYSIHNK